MWTSVAPVILVLLWFLGLIGGYGLGGWINLLPVIALLIFIWNPLRDQTE